MALRSHGLRCLLGCPRLVQLSNILSRSGPLNVSPLLHTPGDFSGSRNFLRSNYSTNPDRLYSEIQIEVRGHDPAVLNSYEKFLNGAAEHLGVRVVSSETPPRIIERRTLLKSKHNYGKYHKVQYERRTHFKVVKMEKLTGSTADTYLEYVQRNLPEGVAMKVTKTHLEKLPEYLKPPTAEGSAESKA